MPDFAFRLVFALRLSLVLIFAWNPCVLCETDDLMSLGRKAYYACEFDRAVEYFTAAIEDSPDMPDAYLRRALAFYGKTDFRRALSDLNVVCGLEKNNALAFYNRAVVHYSMQDYDRSWEDAIRARDLGYNLDPVFFEQLKEDSCRRE